MIPNILKVTNRCCIHSCFLQSCGYSIRKKRSCNDFFYNNSCYCCCGYCCGYDDGGGGDDCCYCCHCRYRVFDNLSPHDRNLYRLYQNCHHYDGYRDCCYNGRYFLNLTYKSLPKLFLLYEISYSRADRML